MGSSGDIIPGARVGAFTHAPGFSFAQVINGACRGSGVGSLKGPKLGQATMKNILLQNPPELPSDSLKTPQIILDSLQGVASQGQFCRGHRPR